MRVHTLNVSAPSVRADFGIPRFPRLGPTSIQLPRNLQLIAIHEDFAWLQDLGLSKFFDTQNPPERIKMDQNGLCWSIYVRRGSRIPRFLGMSMRQPTTCGSKCWPLFSASSASCAAFSVIKPRGGTLKKAVGNQVKSLPHLENIHTETSCTSCQWQNPPIHNQQWVCWPLQLFIFGYTKEPKIATNKGRFFFWFVAIAHVANLQACQTGVA